MIAALMAKVAGAGLSLRRKLRGFARPSLQPRPPDRIKDDLRVRPMLRFKAGHTEANYRIANEGMRVLILSETSHRKKQCPGCHQATGAYPHSINLRSVTGRP